MGQPVAGKVENVGAGSRPLAQRRVPGSNRVCPTQFVSAYERRASRSQVHFEANEREGRALRSGANHWRSAENAARIMARSPIALVPAGSLPKHGEAP